MNTKRKVTITRRTEEVFVVRRATSEPHTRRAWCEKCGAEVDMLTPEEAATHARTSALAIYRKAAAGEIHFAETPGGRLLICPSLLAL